MRGSGTLITPSRSRGLLPGISACPVRALKIVDLPLPGNPTIPIFMRLREWITVLRLRGPARGLPGLEPGAEIRLDCLLRLLPGHSGGLPVPVGRATG